MARSRARPTRRETLVAAARQAVLDYGADVKLVQVAHVAGVTSGAVLYHFPDIKDLLLEANRSGLERFYDDRVTALISIRDPVEQLVVTVHHGLPADSRDDSVRLLCELGGAAGRQPVYAALLTSLYDRQVAMYEAVLRAGADQGLFLLAPDALSIARNLVALEDAYGYRIVAGHPTIDRDAAVQLILDYARVATGNPLVIGSEGDVVDV